MPTEAVQNDSIALVFREASLEALVEDKIRPNFGSRKALRGVFVGDELCCRNANCWHSAGLVLSSSRRIQRLTVLGDFLMTSGSQQIRREEVNSLINCMNACRSGLGAVAKKTRALLGPDAIIYANACGKNWSVQTLVALLFLCFAF